MDVKKVTIGDKSFYIENGYGVQFVYFNTFGVSFVKGVKEIYEKSNEIKDLDQDAFDKLEQTVELIDSSLKLAYSMAKNYDEKIPIYQEWVKSLGDVYQDIDWVSEVAELAASTFRGLQKGATNKK